jgi:peptide/nickel transport system permease protein
VGLLLTAALVAAALAAPLLATEVPWITRGPGGLSFPAFTGREIAGADAVVLRAPVPYSPNRLALDSVLLPPSHGHWLGTDALGRDLAARVLHGARVSLAVGLLASLFAAAIGLPLGALAGYRGGWTDAVISRVIEAVLCFPAILLVLVIVATSPSWLRGLSDVMRIALVLGLTGWVPVARYLRGEFIRLRKSDMVTAALAGGSNHWRIAFRHVLPCSLAPVLVTAAFAVGAAIALEAALSFLGVGVRPPQATWGGLLFEAREQVQRAWWLALFPGLALFLAVLGCNLVGEGVRDLLDPRRTGR